MFVWRHSRKNSAGSCCCLAWSTSTIHTTRHRLTLVPTVGTTNAWHQKGNFFQTSQRCQVTWMTHMFCLQRFPSNRLFGILPSRPSSAYQLIYFQYSMPLWPLRYEEPSKRVVYNASGSRIFPCITALHVFPWGPMLGQRKSPEMHVS